MTEFHGALEKKSDAQETTLKLDLIHSLYIHFDSIDFVFDVTLGS